MIQKAIFLSAVAAATLVVVLLATVSRYPRSNQIATRRLSLIVYIQPVQPRSHRSLIGATSVLVYRHVLTAGPDNSSRPVGHVQGFAIPTWRFAYSPYNIVYLTVDVHGYRGSVCMDARGLKHEEREEMEVVGGTGAFAYARGTATLWRMAGGDRTAYRAMIELRLPT